MIAPPTGDCVFVANEGALRVYADLARQAWAGMGHTLVYIYYKNTARFSVKAPSMNFHCPPIIGQRSRFILTRTLSSPAQLPAASLIKPAGHVSAGLHWNEPGVLMQIWSAPQLWIPKMHSSRSATDKEEKVIRAFFSHPGSGKPPHFSW